MEGSCSYVSLKLQKFFPLFIVPLYFSFLMFRHFALWSRITEASSSSVWLSLSLGSSFNPLSTSLTFPWTTEEATVSLNPLSTCDTLLTPSLIPWEQDAPSGHYQSSFLSFGHPKRIPEKNLLRDTESAKKQAMGLSPPLPSPIINTLLSWTLQSLIESVSGWKAHVHWGLKSLGRWKEILENQKVSLDELRKGN